MKIHPLVITSAITLLMNSSSYAGPIEDALQFPINAYKNLIYEALKEDKNLSPHLPKTVKNQKQEKLQICNFWLDQYSQSATEKNEIKTIESCTAAGIDMSKYQK